MENQANISVKALLNGECKRFTISRSSTFSDLIDTLRNVFACEITDILYRDGEDDLISMGSNEEFHISLNTAPKTGDILRLVVHGNPSTNNNYQSSSACCDDLEIISPMNECDLSIEEANRRSFEMLNSLEDSKPQAIIPPIIKDCPDNQQDPIPRFPTFTNHISSATTSGADRSDKRQMRGRQTQRKKKRKHRESSSSSSGSSSRSSSSSSSSGSSCREGYKFYKKSENKKRKSSPSANMEKMLHKCEKRMTNKVCKKMKKLTKKLHDDLISSITKTVLQQLDGAILQSHVVPNGSPVSPTEATSTPRSPTTKTAESTATKRMRYQHQNVVCDHCENEIFGPRYKCGNCSDYDLCENCEAIEGLHTPSHVFMKMHFPAVHAGRRSIGGKSRPLLRANIYEEREKEREMEDLLQRKLDSGSELNQKVMEKIEKRRTKMKDDQHAKESSDNRKEEWKKMKKEIKKNKKELKKKLKQQGKLLQRNISRGGNSSSSNKEEVFLTKDGFCFDMDNASTKVEQKEPHVIIDLTTATTTTGTTTPDENLSSALSSLQIVHIDPVIVNEVNEAPASPLPVVDVANDSDGVVVVENPIPLDIELNAASSSGNESLRKPDLVDFNCDVLESPTPEDFVVVSNYFDLSVPIDDIHVLEHRNCESCQSCQGNYTPDFIRSHSSCTTSTSSNTNQLPMDLVASVPPNSRNQPDIASPTVNIMDQSIESFSSIASSPPISPEPIISNPFDELVQRVNSLNQENETPEVPVTQTEQFSPLEFQPSVNTEVEQPVQEPITVESEQVLESGNEHTVNEASAPPNEGVSSVEQPIDWSDPIVQAQLREEQRYENNRAERLPSDAGRNESQQLPEDADRPAEAIPAPHTTVTSVDNNGGLSGVLVGAMATLVDTVANVVQSAKGSPKAEYRDGVVEVTMPSDPRAAGMQQLLDMGFFDRTLNDRLLVQYNNDVGRCVADLIAENNNQWHQTRH